MTLLDVRSIGKSFGGVLALTDVSFSADEGEILGIIGPNGAGKTTLISILNGTLKADTGNVTLAGEPLDGRKPYERARMGVGRTYQVMRPFPGMTTTENVAIAARFAGGESSMRGAIGRARDVFRTIGATDIFDRPVEELSTGQRTKLELARAYATQPSILLLDEVMGGLNSVEVTEAMETIGRIRTSGVTVLMIEHVMKAVLGLSDRVLVLHRGRTIAMDVPSQIARNPQVIEAYLGSRFAGSGAHG